MHKETTKSVCGLASEMQIEEGPEEDGQVPCPLPSKGHITHTLCLSVCVFFMRIGWCALGPLLTPMFGVAGAVAGSLSFMAHATGSVAIAPLVVRRIGVRRTLIVGVFLYLLFPMTLMEPSGAAMVVGGVLIGIGSAVFFNAQPMFIASCSTPATVGTHNGVFFAFSNASYLVGNFVGSEMLEHVSVLGLLCLIMGAGGVALGIAIGCIPDHGTSGSSSSVGPMASLKLVWGVLLKSRPLQMYVVAFAWQGWSLGVSLAWFPTNVVTPRYGVGAIGFFMASYGAANIVGCLVAGRAVDMMGRIAVFSGAQISYGMAVGVCISFSADKGPWPYAVASLMGLADAGTQTVVGSVLVSRFGEDLSSAAGLAALVMGTSAFVAMLTVYRMGDVAVEGSFLVCSCAVVAVFATAERRS